MPEFEVLGLVIQHVVQEVLWVVTLRECRWRAEARAAQTPAIVRETKSQAVEYRGKHVKVVNGFLVGHQAGLHMPLVEHRAVGVFQ